MKDFVITKSKSSLQIAFDDRSVEIKQIFFGSCKKDWSRGFRLHIFSSVGGLVLLSPCTNYGSLLNIEEASFKRLPDIATHLPESSRRRVMKKPQDVLIGLYN